MIVKNDCQKNVMFIGGFRRKKRTTSKKEDRGKKTNVYYSFNTFEKKNWCKCCRFVPSWGYVSQYHNSVFIGGECNLQKYK